MACVHSRGTGPFVQGTFAATQFRTLTGLLKLPLKLPRKMDGAITLSFFWLCATHQHHAFYRHRARCQNELSSWCSLAKIHPSEDAEMVNPRPQACRGTKPTLRSSVG